jgi:hypothetical protein
MSSTDLAIRLSTSVGVVLNENLNALRLDEGCVRVRTLCEGAIDKDVEHLRSHQKYTRNSLEEVLRPSPGVAAGGAWPATRRQHHV